MMWTVPVEDDSLTPEDVKNALKSLATARNFLFVAESPFSEAVEAKTWQVLSSHLFHVLLRRTRGQDDGGLPRRVHWIHAVPDCGGGKQAWELVALFHEPGHVDLRWPDATLKLLVIL